MFCCDLGSLIDVYIEVVCWLGLMFVNIILLIKFILIN